MILASEGRHGREGGQGESGAGCLGDMLRP